MASISLQGPTIKPGPLMSSVTARFIALTLAMAFFGVNVVFGNGTVDAVVKGLTESAPGTPAFNTAAATAKTLTDAQAAEAATKIKDKVVGSAVDSATTLLNLYKLGLKAGPNPFVKVLGNVLADALKTALGGLGTVFKDPETNSGKAFINSALEDLGVTDINKRQDIIEAIETQAREDREKQGRVKKQAESRTEESVHFDAASGILSFSDAFVVGVLNPDGTSDPLDTIIGAEVLIPDFTFDGINPEGAWGFVNLSNTPLVMRKGGDVFLQALVGSLLFEDNTFFGFGGDLLLSGAAPDSPFFGGLPNLGSEYVADLNDALFPLDLRYFWALSIFPDADFFELTKGFTADGTMAFTNLEGLTVPEPPVAVVLALAVVAFVVARRRVLSRP